MSAPGSVLAARPADSLLARGWPALAALAILACLWLGPLPERARGSFAAHMVMHMGVVAVAAPLLAVGLSRLVPRSVAALPPTAALFAAALEFLIVWGWHAPALHDAARQQAPIFLAEQASFLLAGLLVWVAAVGPAASDEPGEAARAGARLAGTGGLLLTSMHMTLLGGLLLFAPRPLYACAELCSPAAGLTPLEDQQLGGVLMLTIGGSAYLLGGVVLLGSILKERRGAHEAGERTN
ncbi:cytochrome c oxidase assembly protein [Antarcticirhabdus aurantiaca]|uniref:Cytochrome c oxidase assembly protein n=1 Tax=Antarcticirhabdus aurantiaca TaxID=2606717 RepID=A0ACD4NTI4_9HYPH|nr:cytochrome c oxidase assembly protein [Antarcticirhabdus aurantiaca]WAJ30226.1 cytochrome c oxidase assembly protein [Jeongeuplla avenae]